MRKLFAVIITWLLLASPAWAQGWTVSIGGDVTLVGSAALFPRGQDNRPSIGNQQDTDTGIRFPASGQISFILDGSRAVLFDTNGFVVGVNYFNFGTVAGASGYGIRNNAGTVEYKNSGGAWGTIITTGGNLTFTGNNTYSGTSLFSGIATFTPAPIFSSGTANRVMALDASKALTTSFASADLAGSLTDETGTGVAVLATSPVLVTPNLGTPSAAVLTSATGLPISTGVTGLGTGVATALAVNVGTAGAPVVNGGALGTPSSGTLTSATGLPITGIVAGADDTTLVSSGSAWQAKALANCTDTGGNHLNYTTATNTYSCGTSSSATSKVVQIISVYYATEASSTSSTFADTGLTATITPTSATNKVMVFATVGGVSKAGGNTYDQMQLVTPVTTKAMDNFGAYTNSVLVNGASSSALSYLDSPATSGAATYKVQFASSDNATAVYAQRNGSGSSLTLMEVTP